MRAQRFESPPRYGYARSHESAASPVIRADLTGWPRHRAVIVGSARPPGGVRSIQTLGARKAHMRDRLASCSCGQLRAEVIGDPVRVSICHCLACQRRTGSVFGQQARFRRENVSLSGASSEYVRVGDEGSRVRFHFCPSCGSTVYYELEGMEEYLAIPVGAFADPGFPAPLVSVYESRMHSWVIPPSDAEHIP